MRRNAFHTDGAIVVDGQSGRGVASSWFVGGIRLGGMEGVARSRSAKAVAQQAGGCYVIKCSEDSRGEVVLHLLTERVTFAGTLASDLVEQEMQGWTSPAPSPTNHRRPSCFSRGCPRCAACALTTDLQV